jgi:hypothetical protein
MEHRLPPVSIGRKYMKAIGLKSLVLAMVGIAGFAVAGSAFAQCPTAVTTKGSSTPGGGGAWSQQFIANDATLTISTPGLNSTNCALSLSVGAASNSRANVQDNSPNNEARYRGRFYLNLAGLTNFTASNQTVILFRVNDTTGPAQFSSDQLVIRLAGGATPTLRFITSDANAGSGATAPAVPLPASATNTYRIEFDMQVGSGATTANGCTTMPASGGCIRYWVTDAGAASTDAAPTGSTTINNSGWSGAKTAFLGMSGGSPGYRGNHAGAVLVFDEFDSRRQTFIGQ